MSHFCLLRRPDEYVAADLDLASDAPSREYWLERFVNHFETVLHHALSCYGRSARSRIEAARRQLAAMAETLRGDPAALPGGKLNVMELGRARDKVLRDHGLNDPFAQVKQRHNAAALPLYPEAVHKLHVMDDEAKWLHLIECVFAGNLFDVGSETAVQSACETSFLELVKNVKPRPWLVDDYDRLAEDLLPGPPAKWHQAVVFIDNAGSDFILGVMPFVRELALRGTRVVLAANERPVLNDLTADETAEIVDRLAAADEDLAALISGQMLEVVSTGNDLALIDLADVSDELNAAAAEADLVILEGMGRAIESNFNATFIVDSLHLALLKDPHVAARIGGEMNDCVCRYVPAEA